MAPPAGYENPDEWELVDDEGFVHKRRKRPRLDPAAEPPAPDSREERKHHLELKKAGLRKLRDKYLKEINMWELLSNTSRETEQNAQTQLLELESRRTPFSGASISRDDMLGPESTRRRAIDDLLSQVEAQEAMIRDIKSLCSIAEALCSAEEERLKQQFNDLTIWEPTPHELMAALEAM